MNYITYQCDKCKRTLDVQQNNSHTFINNCTITLHCLGKLSPISTQKTRNVLPVSIDNNLLDNAIVSSQLTSPTNTLLSLNSQTNILTLAVKDTGTLPDTISLTFVLNSSTQGVPDYLEYTYSIKNTNTILGKDNSPTQKVFKYSSNNTVVVYANGVLQKQGQDYYLQNGISIVFHNDILYQTNVRILVYTQNPVIYSSPIIFTKNELFSMTSAWSNVRYVQINGEQWKLYSCFDISPLNVNTRMNVNGVKDMMFLLSNPSYTPIDRNLFESIPMENIDVGNSPETNYVILSVQNGNYVLKCTQSSIQQPTSLIIPDPLNENTFINSDMEIVPAISSVLNSDNINGTNFSNILGVF